MKNRMTQITLPFLCLGIVTLVACQSSPKTVVSCESADWYELGRRTGTTGQPSQLDQERKRCTGQFDHTQEAVYINGYNNGLTEYCTNENGYALGKSGATLNKVCPRPIDEAFVAGYMRGTKVRELQQVNENIDRKISSINQRLKSAKDKKNEHGQLMSEITGLEQERQANRKRLNQIEKQIN
jgi:hypothetical protein